MTDPKVSVVIAVYNGVPYLKKALDSVLAQTHPAHEIIVIDDGSTDETPRLLTSYGNKIITQRFANAGVATAMNRGLELATGDYVAFLDHDDVWFRDKLKKQVEAMERYPEAGLACCNFAHRPAALKRRVFHFSKLTFPEDFDFKEPLLRDPFLTMAKNSIIGTSSVVLLRRDFAKKVGFFNPRYRVSGDYDYWMRCSLLAPFVVLNDVLLYKRTHATNISADMVLTFTEYRQVLRNLPLEFQKMGGNKAWEAICRQEAANISYMMGNHCFDRGDKAKAFEFFREGVQDNRTIQNFLVGGSLTLKKKVRSLLHG